VKPGNHTVTFTIAGNTTTRDKQGIAVKASTSTSVNGCFMQPMSLSDVVGDTKYSESTHKCISPTRGPDTAANAAVSACKAEDTLVFRGVSYRVQGVQVYDTWNGTNDHVTVICQRQDG